MDPWDGQTLRYDAKRGLLWSVGDNLTDEQGKSSNKSATCFGREVPDLYAQIYSGDTVLPIHLKKIIPLERRPLLQTPSFLKDAATEFQRQNHDQVTDKIEAEFNKIDSPLRLRGLFWTVMQERAKPGASEFYNEVEIPNLILNRLAAIKTDEALKVLVDLWADPEAHWDAGPSELACDTVLSCGKAVLPLLEAKRPGPDPERIEHLIKLIQSGATTAL